MEKNKHDEKINNEPRLRFIFAPTYKQIKIAVGMLILILILLFLEPFENNKILNLSFLHKSPVIPSLSPSNTPIPLPTLTENDEAGIILRESSIKCPDETIVLSWLKSTLKKDSISSKEESGKVRENNKFLWACYILFNKSYGQNNPNITLIISKIPTVTKIQENKNTTSISLDTESHYGCDSSGRCLLLTGKGSNECSNDRHCKHAECNNNYCMLVNGKGDDKCTSGAVYSTEDYITFDTGCSHAECSDGKCVLKSGKGDTQCTLNSECKHTECKDLSCVTVNGKGTNQCSSSNVYLVEGVYFNLSCAHADCGEGNRCIIIPGAGTTKCSQHADCNR